jgi:hypothetical protein
VKRSELAHILRAACDVTSDPEILVLGSQAILGSFDDDELPSNVVRSIEADIAFFDDPDERKSDAVDGAIGEESMFHETNGVYGQGVSLSTAILPEGWRSRVVAFDDPEAKPGRAVCLEPHDLVISKLVAGRMKDREFAQELVAHGLVDPVTLSKRAVLLPVPGAVKRRVLAWIDSGPPDRGRTP